MQHDIEETQQLELFARRPDPEAIEALVSMFLPLARDLARRYAHRGESLDDLTQVASLGLLQAINRFDPDYGVAFPSYAVPTILGELKRHFRDCGWALAVPRRLKELSQTSRKAADDLAHRLGRQPTVEEVAAEVGVSVDDVAEAAGLTYAYRTESIDEPGDADTDYLEKLGNEDHSMGNVLDRMTLEDLLESRPPVEREILYLRFYEEMTQREIAEVVGMSQMNVSRILSSSFEKLRLILTA